MTCGCLCGTTAGCERERSLSDEAEAPTQAPHPAPAAPSGASLVREYELVPGPVELTFGPRRRPVTGHLQLAQGRLWLDASELNATRAVLTFDLASLVVDEPSWPDAPVALQAAGTLTEQSLDWLEVRDPAQLAASPGRRYARFDVSSFVAGTAEARAGQAQPSTPGARAQRVRGRATGKLELHGFRLPYTVGVVVTFSWFDPAPPDAPPGRLELAMSEPASIELLRHEVVPRTARGEIRAEALAELRKLPTNTVQVSGRWVAELVGQNQRP